MSREPLNAERLARLFHKHHQRIADLQNQLGHIILSLTPWDNIPERLRAILVAEAEAVLVAEGYTLDHEFTEADREGPLTVDDLEARDLDPDLLVDMIALAGYTVPLEVVQSWTREQRRAADQWASLEHLAAGHAPGAVERLPMPAFVQAAARRYGDTGT